jgi:hypothetical protein
MSDKDLGPHLGKTIQKRRFESYEPNVVPDHGPCYLCKTGLAWYERKVSATSYFFCANCRETFDREKDWIEAVDKWQKYFKGQD